jgi:hypothetical protein
VTVHLFTAESVDRYLMGAGLAPYGPDYSTAARFDAPTVEGMLLALGTFGRKDGVPTSEPAYHAFVATRTMMLADGDARRIDLTLEPAKLGLVAGSVELPDGRQLTGTHERYRFPYPGSIVGSRQPTTFEQIRSRMAAPSRSSCPTSPAPAHRCALQRIATTEATSTPSAAGSSWATKGSLSS